MTARLLMIALDAADGRLLEEWIIAGDLPHLAALSVRGAVKRLIAPYNTDDALWASFQYGVPVGEHGRYHYRIQLSTGKFGMAHIEESNRNPFWRDLANQGLRVAVLDVPKCSAPQPLNGIHLVDWLVHGRYFCEPKSFPPSLATEIVERFGPAPPSRCGYQQNALSDEDVIEMVGNLRSSLAKKRAAGLWYLAAEPWDLFVIGFKEAHCAGHHLWNFVDVRHAEYDPTRNIRLGEPVRTIFEDIDAAVGELVACAGPGAEVVVFSTSDMEPNGTLDHLMPEVVNRLNMCLCDRHASQIARAIGKRLGNLAFFIKQYCSVLPYNENAAALRVRQRGPYRDAAWHDCVLQEIETLLLELTDADTGERVVASFARPSCDHSGAKASSLPDLLIRYRTNASPRAVVSPQLGRIEVEPSRMRPGNHSSGGGLLISAGNTVGRFVHSVESLEDFALLANSVLSRAKGTQGDGMQN